MASKEVNLSSEEWLRRDLLASRPQLGDVNVSYFVVGLPRCDFAGSLGRLPASFAAFLRLALFLLPVFLSTRPRLALVLFPCALLLGTRACAQLLPDRQGNRHPVNERACRVAGATAQGDGGLQPMTGRGLADRRAHMPASRCASPAQERDRPSGSKPGPASDIAKPLPLPGVFWTGVYGFRLN